MLNILVPRICRICGQSLARGEELMCLQCYLYLPRTGVHQQQFNEIHKRLGHKCRIDRAAGWYQYQRGSAYSQMLIDAKYAGQPSIDRKLGAMCAAELQTDGFFQGIDFLVPMPMHWTKRWRRGYNQARHICLGVESVTDIPVIDALRARRAHGTQARNSRDQRYQSIAGTLGLTRLWPHISGKNILLIDDIITTGATASEAIQTLWAASPKTISLLSLALTTLNH